ncbi:tetratricopeptide repeat protein [Candidatus Sumerlaeota bacterium]|nr:tetratricopeptide repeat protein [Candidatus Sumerlaeota bacterium]
MIVRDEASHIAPCLRATRGLVDEMIVIDTGSTDGTDELARAEGAQVHAHAWPGSFAEARNLSLGHASGDWVLVLDADERVAAADFPRIRALIGEGRHDGFTLIQRTYSDDSDLLGWRPAPEGCAEAQGFSGFFDSGIVRLFRRDPEIAFEGVIHELVEEVMERAGRSTTLTDIVIHHYKEEKTQREKRQKSRLYLDLCEVKCREHPQSALAAKQLGMVLFDRGQFAEAAEAYGRAASLDPDDADAVASQGVCLMRAGDFERAESVYTKALGRLAESPDLLVGLGTARLHRGDPRGAHEILMRAANLRPDHFAAALNLGAACMDLGRAGEAMQHLRRACRINPQSADVWLNIGLLQREAQRPEEALESFQQAWRRDRSRWQTALGLGTAHMDLGDQDEAAQWLKRARDLPGAGAVVWAQLCALRMQQGRMHEALASAREAAARDPRFADLPRRFQ